LIETKQRKLISLACSFNSNFNQFLASHDSRILPKLKTGIVQQPIDNIYWQKECGAFKTSGDNLWSLEEESNSTFLPTDYYDDEGNHRIGMAYVHYQENEGKMLPTGIPVPVIPRKECLLYIGEWSYLESHLDVKQSEEWYWNSIGRLTDHLFESAVTKHLNYKFLLQSVKREKVGLNDSFNYSHDDEWLLKLFILKVTSGALEMYFDPLREQATTHLASRRKALDANLGTLFTPSKSTATTASRLITKIKEDLDGVDIEEIAVIAQLEKLAARESYRRVKKTIPLKALVREISALSQMLLDTSNDQKSRFPPAGIQNILGLIDAEASKTQIKKYQSLYDDSNEQYLSTGYQ
jgi:hypothetical protein